MSSALSRAVGVLCGSPGTGKTFTVASLVRALHADGITNIGLCAPTGKAAVRVTDSLSERGVDGLRAVTIHSLLRLQYSPGQGMCFYHNRARPLPYDVVIVDEFSMCDADIFSSLLEACRRGTHLLLVGDPYQLPPVNHGAPLRDMLVARWASGELHEIHRNAGLIVRACKDIKERGQFETSPKYDPATGQNLKLVHGKNPADMAGLLRTFVQQQLAKPPGEHPAGRWFDMFEEFHVLTMMNAGSEVSRANLNRILQEELNPDGYRAENNPFRVGDKMICLRNGWQYAVAPPDGQLAGGMSKDSADYEHVAGDDGKSLLTYVANGDIGRVMAVGLDKPGGRPSAVVTFTQGRMVRVPVLARANTQDEDFEDEAAFDLGYATTVHKAQGSQWKVVVFMADPSSRASFVASRELVYTALSRAQNLCIVIGQKKQLETWCQRKAIWDRRTFLAQDIEKAIRPAVANEEDDL